jgi:patatin-like phospholipase/acyl hydrolase
LNNLTEKKYPITGIEEVLEEYFGESRLRDAVTDVLVTSYEIERSFPFFFKSSAARRFPDHDFAMRDVARATSAAPTYFQPLKLENVYTLIDGGVYANNPAACAYVEARTTFPEASNYTVLSLGTGCTNDGISYDASKNWGVAQWAKPILDVVFDGVSSTVDYQLRQIVPNYYRFQTTLDSEHAAFDNANPANITALQGLALDFIDQQPEQIEKLCDSLTRI